MDKKSRNAQPLHIKDIIPQVLTHCRRSTDVDLMKVWDIWERAVGAAISENARPAAFKGRILLIHVSNSMWLHQLQFLKDELVDKLNDALGAPMVGELKLKIGPV